jgi:hypothetical protein
MYAVAITELAGGPEAAAAAIAPILGKTPYEMRLELVAGMPALVLTTPEVPRATEIAVKLRALGHGVLAFDTTKVVSSDDMIGMKRFRLDPDGIGIEDRPGEKLPYDEVWALIRAVHRFDSETREQVKGKQFSPMRALATGGLMVTKASTSEVRSVANEKSGVLYLFRRTGKTPWILRETGTNYAALGAACAPSQVQNFGTTVRLLRERMPQVAFDDRLVTMKRIRQGEAISRPGVSIESSTVPWTDLLAHVVAYSVSQRAAGPYRT